MAMSVMLLKIKQGKLQEWEKWCSKLSTEYLESARETIVEENLIRESCRIFQEGDQSYVVYIHETEGDAYSKLPANMSNPLNVEHFRKFHECLEKIPLTSVAYDIQAKTPTV